MHAEEYLNLKYTLLKFKYEMSFKEGNLLKLINDYKQMDFECLSCHLHKEARERFSVFFIFLFLTDVLVKNNPIVNK